MIFREPSILFHRTFTLKKYNSCITAAGAGRVSATAADDGLVANDGILISGGTLAVTSGGGSANTAVKTGNAMFGRGRGDGFNAAGGTDDSAENGMFGPDAFASDATKTLTFEGSTGNLGGMREPGGMQAPANMQQPGGRAF